MYLFLEQSIDCCRNNFLITDKVIIIIMDKYDRIDFWGIVFA